MKKRLAVLVSGTGRSLLNLLERERDGALPTKTVLVVSSKAKAKALAHAEAFGVPWVVAPEDRVTEALDAVHPDFVVMAGYVKHWPIPDRYIGRTVNIHPALLPEFGGKGFYGDRVHENVLRSETRVTGCTVHFVTAEYDAGPIIAQHPVPVLPEDNVASLAARVFEAERELLPEVIGMLARDELRLVDGRVEYA